MFKRGIAAIFLLLFNFTLLFATSTADFKDGGSVVFLVDDFHSSVSNEISYDIYNYLFERDLECDLINCESSISRQKWLVENEINLNDNLKYLIMMPLSYYGFERSLEMAASKGIHIIIVENDINYESAIKILVPWQKASNSLLSYVSSSDNDIKNFVELQGNLMGGNASSISTEFKKNVTKNNWKINRIQENCSSRQLGYEKTLSYYRTAVDKGQTFFFAHTMEASRGFLDASLMIDQDSLQLLSLDVNDAIKKSILCGYTTAGIYYERNYGERINQLIEDNNLANSIYYLDYELISKETLDESE